MAIALCSAPLASAATCYWSPTGDNHNWSTPENWGGIEPTAGDDVILSNGDPAYVDESVNALPEDCKDLYLSYNPKGGTTGTITQTAKTMTVSGSLCIGTWLGSTGTYNLTGGTLVLKSITTGPGTAVFNFGGGTLQASGGFTSSLPMNLTGTGGAANVDTTTFNVTLSGSLSGVGGLNKLGAATLTLAAADMHSGDTTISEGTLAVTNSNALQNSTLVCSSTGTFSCSLGTLNLGGLKGNHSLSLFYTNAFGTQPIALTVGGNNQSTVFDGVIGSSTVLGSLNKVGSGTFTLTAANTYRGDTKITAGTLALTNANALQNSTLDHSSASGTLNVGVLTGVSLGGLKGNQTLTLTNDASAAVALTIGNNGQSTTFNGSINGLGSLNKVGSGTLTLSGSGSFAGDTTIASGGTIALSNTGPAHTNCSALQNSTVNCVLSGGSLIVNPLTSALTSVTLGGLKGDRGLTLAYNFPLIGTRPVELIVGNNGQSTAYSGPLSGLGSLTKIGAGAMAVSGSNTYAGQTKVNGGTLLVKKPGSLPAYATTGNVVVGNGATLAVNAGGSGEWRASEIQGLLAAATLNPGSIFGIDTTGGDLSYGYVIGGDIGLTKLGVGELTLSGALDYTGTTTIDGGVLRINTPSATLHQIVGSGGLAVGDGVHNSVLTADSIRVGSLTISGTPGEMQAVPEPSSFALLAAALAVCAALARLRKQS
jgi:autotransporter-associated beta strand protein